MIAAVLAAAAACPAAAQQPALPPYKIGFVNTERVVRDSLASHQMQKDLDADFRKQDNEITSGPPADVERRRKILIDHMNVRRDDALKHLLDKADSIVKRIAAAEKFDIVFYEATYANARIDLTEKVMKELDAAR